MAFTSYPLPFSAIWKADNGKGSSPLFLFIYPCAKQPAYRVIPVSYTHLDVYKRQHVARGETSVFTLYAATDAFLNFKGLQEASSRVMLAVNDTHRRTGTVFLPPQGLLAVASSTPVSVSGTALYNYTEGYGSYLIPAVMIVIIFQTMLMVIAMLTGEEAEQQREGV